MKGIFDNVRQQPVEEISHSKNKESLSHHTTFESLSHHTHLIKKHLNHETVKNNNKLWSQK